MNLVEWFTRKFEATAPVELFPNVLMRLRGAPVRVEEEVGAVAADRLCAGFDGTWSIQRNVGHLTDLDALWSARLTDFLGGAAVLTPADLENRRTHEADHDERQIGALLAEFRAAREQLLVRLDGLEPESFALIALHPRLEQPMRLIDLLVFVAEHDDHHLTRIRQLRMA